MQVSTLIGRGRMTYIRHSVVCSVVYDVEHLLCEGTGV